MTTLNEEPKANGADGQQVAKEQVTGQEAPVEKEETSNDSPIDFSGLDELFGGPSGQKTTDTVSAEETPGETPETPQQEKPETESAGEEEVTGEKAEIEEPPEVKAEQEEQPEQTDYEKSLREGQQKAQQQAQQFEQSLYEQYRKYVADSLSEDDVEALQTSPEKVFPKLAAGLAIAIRRQLGHEFMQALPQHAIQAVTQYASQRKSEQALSQKFKGLDLNNPRHRQVVEMVAKTYREANRNADPETAINAVGLTSMQLLGIPAPEEKGEKAETSSTEKKEEGYKPLKASGSASRQPSLEENLSGQKTKTEGEIDENSDLWPFLQEQLGLEV